MLDLISPHIDGRLMNRIYIEIDFAIWANVASSFKQIDTLYRDEAGDF